MKPSKYGVRLMGFPDRVALVSSPLSRQSVFQAAEPKTCAKRKSGVCNTTTTATAVTGQKPAPLAAAFGAVRTTNHYALE